MLHELKINISFQETDVAVLYQQFVLRYQFQSNLLISGMEDPATYPEYVLAIHSSKRLLVEQISPPAYVLAGAIISLTLAKGQRHEVSTSQ